jgi:hypothetical protein
LKGILRRKPDPKNAIDSWEVGIAYEYGQEGGREGVVCRACSGSSLKSDREKKLYWSSSGSRMVKMEVIEIIPTLNSLYHGQLSPDRHFYTIERDDMRSNQLFISGEN